jgi:hypothetical protein
MNIRIRAALVTAAALTYLALCVPASAETVASAGPPAAESAARCAPADEYFGPLRLSVLGLRNSLTETASRIERGQFDSESTLEHLALLEASLRDWEARYPGDAWLPRMVLNLHRTYRSMDTDEALLRSIDAASWLMRDYAGSHEARTLRLELAAAMRDESSGGQPEDAAVAVPARIDENE